MSVCSRYGWRGGRRRGAEAEVGKDKDGDGDGDNEVPFEAIRRGLLRM